MAEPLKTRFGADVVAQIADGLVASVPTLDRQAFIAECLVGFDELELMARAARVAEVMRGHLDDDPAAAVGQLAGAIGEPMEFGYLAHSAFIGTYGVEAYPESMAAMHTLTQAFTAEFCIRPFLVRYPQTLGQLRQWASDPSEHVRRLVSEGTRPRLPWATRLPAFQADPVPVVELLELLKDDPSPYVLRSVGNNLNDISRDNPEIALQVAAGWLPERGGLVRRGLRTLLKAGDSQALALLGYEPSAVGATARLPQRIRIGEQLPIEVTLRGAGPVLVDLRVHFIKANGTTSPKVFRGGELVIAGEERFRRTISFAHHTTRTPYPGPHLIEALVNGMPQELGVVEVVEEDPGTH